MLLLILLLTVSQSFATENNPVVVTKLGKIRGHYKTSFEQKKYSAFEGIPYAKPPVGERRFEEPAPVDPWDGTWEANFLLECPQMTDKGFSGNEDCLYLNVYLPRQCVNSSEKLDVIVHIHGGAFIFGSGHAYAFPGYIMDHDVIFVTFNYRLGILGFLSAEDKVLPGNNGLKDQVLALKWVQENIACFGGDPTTVTLTGTSAGGTSVHLHYLSPMSRGLFKKGFSQSGSALNPWIVKRGSLNKTQTLARSLGCSETPTRNLIECLKQRNVKQIIQQTPLFYSYLRAPSVTFGPVVENGSNPFLPEVPQHLLTDRKVYDVPWLVSFVHDEGNYMASRVEKESRPEYDTVWTKLAPYVLQYDSTCPKESWATISQKIKKYYCGQNKLDLDTLGKILTDGYMVEGILDAVQQHAKAANASVYLFELSYKGSKSAIEHADDIKYFYYNETANSPSKSELKMRDILIEMLLNYVKTDKPFIEGINWKPVEVDNLSFLNISGIETSDRRIETSTDVWNVNFWRSLNLKLH